VAKLYSAPACYGNSHSNPDISQKYKMCDRIAKMSGQFIQKYIKASEISIDGRYFELK
jgi:hypothetical protein